MIDAKNVVPNVAPKVVVRSTQLEREKEFQGKVYGWQNAAIFNGGDFPAPFAVNAPKDAPYPPGEYVIDPRSYRIDENGNLRLKSIKLLPVKLDGK